MRTSKTQLERVINILMMIHHDVLGIQRYRHVRPSNQPSASATTQCQRCLERGHWTYECKNPPAAYKPQPTRTKRLRDTGTIALPAKNAEDDGGDNFMGSGVKKESTAARLLRERQEKRRKERRRRRSSSSSSSGSSSTSSGSSSTSDSDSDNSSDASTSSSTSSSSASSSSSLDSNSSSSSLSESSDSDSSSSSGTSRRRRHRRGRSHHRSRSRSRSPPPSRREH